MSKPKIEKYELTELEIKILNILQRGHKNAIGLKDLCLRMGEKEDRKVRLAIESLRLQQYIILYGQKEKIYIPDHTGKLIKTILPSGYYLDETEQEVNEFLEYMLSRIKAECRIRHHLKQAKIKKYSHQFGQIKMFLT